MMVKNLKKIIQITIFLILPVVLYGQKDVTKFLDIPIDGFKPEMIKKLKSKGYTVIQGSEDELEGEFNGTYVNIGIVTNNNKVWRIGIVDANYTDEINIKIRFNNLIQQFMNNERYVTESDSTIGKYTIPKEEDISYVMRVKEKRYQASFYQKPIKLDSLKRELQLIEDRVAQKDSLNDKENEKLKPLMTELFTVYMNKTNKTVWFMIEEKYGEYRIKMFYENGYNEADGSGL
ncbi:hypothetical protein OAB20_06340 [Winogradskyella sp.]|nr:hypothetical protein [Winogradskyella sp.]